jgi:predicted peptidase
VKAIIKVVITVIVVFLISQLCFADGSSIIDNPEYIIYVPSGIDYSQKYPLVIALHPIASASSMIYVWKGVAEEQKWIIFASKEFRNGIDMNKTFSGITDILGEVCTKFPIDKSKIIATGFSGGAMGAHAFAFSYPRLISAVIINTGMIHEHYLGQKFMYPRGKIAVFLASPTDFRYTEMERDQKFLQDLGWQTKWIEFTGGHILAPDSAYREAAQWLKEQFE